MTIALAGVICLQVYWLEKAVDLEKKNFTAQVRRAMLQATAQVERGEAFSMLTDAFVPGLEPFETYVHPGDTFVHGRPGTSVEVYRSKERIATHVVPPHPRHDSMHPRVPVPPNIPGGDSLRLKVVVPPLPPVPPGSPVPPVPPHPPGTADSIIVVNTSDSMIFVRREQHLKSAVKDVWMKYITHTGKATDRVRREEIEHALEENFRDAGITEKFAFAVQDSAGGKFEFLEDSARIPEFRAAGFSAPLFPSDLNPAGEKLVVLLDGHHERIIRALWPQFLVSLLFTLFLVTVFFFTFREALRQKKLSDIRNDFINNMTHEFKTPIATISLAADTVMNEKVIGDAARVRHYAEVITRENKRLNDQVEKVLELALTERNGLQLMKEPLDLNEVLARVIQGMALQVNARGGTIASVLSSAPCTIEGDTFHLERVFLNLLDNAIKYTTGKPEVTVRTSCAGKSVIVDITDNGIGISKDEQGRIFDRFYRVSTGNRHDVKGFGLGLSYVKTIVEKHGGKITVDSKPGQGTTFRVTFTA